MGSINWWKSKPYWLKGGIIGSAVGFCYFIFLLIFGNLNFIEQSPFLLSILNVIVNISVKIIHPLLILSLELKICEELGCIFFFPFYGLIEGSILGVIIGWIIGKIKSRKQ